MGRKLNQGEARRATRAKAHGVNEEKGGENYIPAPIYVFMEHIWNDEKCWHHVNNRLDFTGPFVIDFHEAFIDAVKDGERSLPECLIAACVATMRNDFADMWKDAAELEKAMSFFWFAGTQQYLKDNYFDARDFAVYARYFEQYIVVELKQTQALFNWIKIEDTYCADKHTLVKFFRHRIPCSCLDERYEEVKHIPKMGRCYNPQCSIPDRKVERSETKYCSRCRSATYCCRKCQEADWPKHKPDCDKFAAMIAKFEAKQQNM